MRGEGKYSLEDFNTSVYNTGDSTDRPYYMINELSSGMLKAASTGFHHFLDQLAVSGRLLRHYTQNVNCIERTLPSISPDCSTTLRIRHRRRYSSMAEPTLMCHTCRWTAAFKHDLFHGPSVPSCQQCEQKDTEIITMGKRSISISRLRPKMLRYEDSRRPLLRTYYVEFLESN